MPLSRFAILALALVVAACGGRVRPQSTDQAMSFDQAMQAIATNLSAQVQRTGLLDRVNTAVRGQADVPVVIDPFIDAQNGYAVTIGPRMQDAIGARMRDIVKNYSFAPLTAEGFNRAALVMTGAVSYESRAGAPQGKAYRVSVSLTDTKTGNVAAQSSAWLQERQLDMKPLPIYQDSPVFLTDRYTRGLLATVQTPAGRPADKTYFSQLSTAALVAEAQQAFAADDTQKSLALFQRAETRPDGKTLKIYSGLYVNHLRNGDFAEAEKVFAQLIAVAFAENSLSIRLLYRVNSTDFINEPRLTQQYRFWVRTLAQHITRTRACVDVQGHSSRTGSDAYNIKLSTDRAEALRRALQQESPGVLALTNATGRGTQDNLVGSGSDDDRDAIDRRVEFKIIDCARVRK